ncbi:DUF1223 domain-containing protein [Tropicibacter oceani]|uniref:DUF1223 domain-containing protein n=1 Tax=Tropicibacter oceani TaxID=3058420 RepID=A0ABY8QHH2_9RHOB|nr:DUF1223 domain-containing protein [Tropicibacter oceani]WGW03252.1 DUF1223 domain-containing protein [Tropicibacter oceani]
MLARLIFTLALWASLCGGAQAQDNPVVVELFTSQGCSSCPPADALLAELGQRDDVIPLALHVDYWDYIGWKDRFAKPGFTTRQKGYARAQGEKMVYTPQIIVNGVEDTVGSRPMKVAELIQKHAAHPAQVKLEVSRQGGQLVIRASSAHPMRPSDIHIVRYQPRREIAILRGENAGNKFTYTHIVDDWKVAGRWDGQGTYETRVPIEGDQPVVVLVQEPRYGPIVAAARLR